jgi:DNA helicase HerA-like ATPase
MHVLILGITGTGKTTLAFRLAAEYRQNNINVLVLDPDLRTGWNADFITDNPETFLEVVKVNKSCALFIDESGQMIGRYSREMAWLATNARKWGHKSHFITQRASQLDPTIRNQCTSIFLFKQSLDDTKNLVNEFCSNDLEQAHTLRIGEYLGKIGVDGEVFKSRAWKLDGGDTLGEL